MLLQLQLALHPAFVNHLIFRIRKPSRLLQLYVHVIVNVSYIPIHRLNQLVVDLVQVRLEDVVVLRQGTEHAPSVEFLARGEEKLYVVVLVLAFFVSLDVGELTKAGELHAEHAVLGLVQVYMAFLV